MLKKTKKLAAYLMLSAAIVFTSCGGSEEENNDFQNVEQNESDTDSTDTDTEEVVSEEIDYMLPSPLQVASILDNAGMEYSTDLLNDTENADQYTLKWKKSLNFGVYSADLAFSVLNDKTQEARDYMKVVKLLADDIGLQAIFDGDDLMNRFENSIGDEEQTMEVLIEIQEKTDEYLFENEKQYIGVVTFSGAWIEGMYFGANDALKNKTEDIGYALSEQMIILENLIKGLDSEPNDSEEIGMVIEYFKKINESYNNFDSVQNYDETQGELILTKDEIKTISDLIMELRNKIVNV